MMLLVCLCGVSAVGGENDLSADRLARAKAWQAERQAHLPGMGDLPPVGTNDDPPLAADLGGEDILIESSANFPVPIVQITSTGMIYIAVTRLSVDYGYEQVINIYRSADGGNTFQLWSVFDDPSSDLLYFVADFDVAEGISDRAFVTYTLEGSSGRYVKVAYAELAASSPTWTYTTPSFPTNSYFTDAVELESDAVSYDDYYLYLAGSAYSGKIWFTRSLDRGATWETAYEVVSETESGSDLHVDLHLSFGVGDVIHLAYENRGSGPGFDNAVYYRQAGISASGGAAGWSDATVIRNATDGIDTELLALAASPNDGTVLMHLSDVPSGTFILDTRLAWSTDSGGTWPAVNEADTDVLALNRGDIDIDPASGSVFLLGKMNYLEDRQVITTQRTTLATPGVLFPQETWCRQDSESSQVAYDLAHDPTHGNQRAVVWINERNGAYEVYFDAEWHRDPGWPNTEAGFPLALDGIGRTPPALANMDDDPFLEIIFATQEGLVYVVNHDGTIADGWPVSINVSVPWDAPVAVGDLNGDSEREVVVGGNNGWAYALHADGTPLTGWPRNMGTSAATYVSIGALGTTSERQVLVCSGNTSRVLSYDGSFGPSWGLATQSYNQPGAIGDVDGDGVNEIVIHQGGSIHLHRLGNTGNLANRSFPGETLYGMPSLMDMDEDGDLEIAVGTTEGKVYLMHHDFSDYSVNFPYDSGVISPVLGVIPVDLLGSNVPELVFSQIDGLTDIIRENGNTGFGYPNFASTGGSIYMPPIVTNVLGPSPDVVVSVGNALDCWENLGAVPPGWPRQMGNPVEESVAAGDIDLDGNIEIVALGLNQLTVFDVGSAPNVAAHRTWPMFGYNAQRTGCLDCPEAAFSAVDDPLPASPTRLAMAPPFPNPASSQTALGYALPVAAQVKLQIFDVRGRLIRTLADGQQEAGHYEVFWNGKAANGRRVALGMYLAKLSVNGPDGADQRVKKISLVR